MPPRDDRAMAEAIITLLKDSGQRAQMGAAGLARAQSKFSAERMLQETLRVYKRVAIKGHEEQPSRTTVTPTPVAPNFSSASQTPTGN